MTANDQRAPVFSSDLYGDRARLREAARDRIYKERDQIAERVGMDRGLTPAELDRLGELTKELERLGDQDARDMREQKGSLTGEEIDRLNQLNDEAGRRQLTPEEEAERQRLQDLLDTPAPEPAKPPFEPPGPDSEGRMIAGNGPADGGQGSNEGANDRGTNGQGGSGQGTSGQGGSGEGGSGQGTNEQGTSGQGGDPGDGSPGDHGGVDAYTDGDAVTGTRRAPALGGARRISLSDAARHRLGGVLDGGDGGFGGFGAVIGGGGPAQPGHVVGDPSPETDPSPQTDPGPGAGPGPATGGVRGPSPEDRDRYRRPGADPGVTDPPDDL